MKKNDASFFYARLCANQHWRLFPYFKDSVAYVDIETTGLSSHSDYITTIALYDGRQVYYYINGQNLDDFVDDINKYQMIITYNGKTFDVPFVQNYFGINLRQAHIDLRYILASLGFSGGLKECERKLGLDRGELRDMDGFIAVLLWNEYQRSKNQAALETLLAYNIEDVLNLEILMSMSFNFKIAKTPFYKTHKLTIPTPVANPFSADKKILERFCG